MNVIRAARTGALLALAVVVAALAGCGQKTAQPAAGRSAHPCVLSASAGTPSASRLASPSAAPVAGPRGSRVPASLGPGSVTFVRASKGWVLGTASCAAKPCTSG